MVRVGVLAKGLLLRDDLSVQLIVVCSEKPTRTLLDTVADRLTKQLQVTVLALFNAKICWIAVHNLACAETLFYIHSKLSHSVNRMPWNFCSLMLIPV